MECASQVPKVGGGERGGEEEKELPNKRQPQQSLRHQPLHIGVRHGRTRAGQRPTNGQDSMRVHANQ